MGTLMAAPLGMSLSVWLDGAPLDWSRWSLGLCWSLVLVIVGTLREEHWTRTHPHPKP
jgi:hypothetical protein